MQRYTSSAREAATRREHSVLAKNTLYALWKDFQRGVVAFVQIMGKDPLKLGFDKLAALSASAVEMLFPAPQWALVPVRCRTGPPPSFQPK